GPTPVGTRAIKRSDRPFITTSFANLKHQFIPARLLERLPKSFFNLFWSLPYCDATSLMKVLGKVFLVLVDINNK
ncbi:MAG: hypothetical protein ACO36I_26505, partial [Candidatus Latescibacterota bacterium]